MSGVLAAMLGSSGAPGQINGGFTPGGTAAIIFDMSFSNAGAYGDPNQSLSWVTPATAAVAAYYEIRVDVTGGAFDSGDSTGAWVALSTSRLWRKNTVGTVNFEVRIREASTQTVRQTWTGLSITVT